jgi:hypothetical protein
VPLRRGSTDKYKWLQSETEIILEFPIPKGTKSKQIVVKLETRWGCLYKLNPVDPQLESAWLFPTLETEL